MAKYLDSTGLTHLWAKIKNRFVEKEDGKGLSTNDYTTAEKDKLAGIAAGAEVNVQSDWKQTHTTADDYIKNRPIINTHSGSNMVSNIMFGLQSNISSDDRNNITIESIDDDVKISAGGKALYNGKEIAVKDDLPTKTSELNNDSGFITLADVPDGAAASTTTPKMDGTAAVGTETAFARGDHRHPSDTTKADKSATVSTVAYDTTKKKITKTINGTTTDVVTAAKIVTDGGGVTDVSGKVDKTTTVNGHALSGNVTVSKSDVGLGNVENKSSATIRGEITSSNVTTALGFTPVDSTAVGAASGVCPLDANQKVPAANLPSYVDDVIESYARSGQTALSSTWLATGSATGTVITPEAGKIYVLMADSGDYAANSQFRWGGTEYVKLNDGGVSAITNAEIDSITSN